MRRTRKKEDCFQPNNGPFALSPKVPYHAGDQELMS